LGDINAIGLTHLTRCDKIKIDMNLNPFRSKKIVRKTIADYKQEVLVKQGKEQFQSLLKKGLSVPVVLL